MSLVSRINDVVTAIGLDISNITATLNEIINWINAISVSSASFTIAPAAFEMAETTITDARVLEGMTVTGNLTPNNDFDVDDLADLKISFVAMNGAIKVTVFGEILVGNYTVSYQLFS